MKMKRDIHLITLSAKSGKELINLLNLNKGVSKTTIDTDLNPRQQELVKIWNDILKTNVQSINDDFFKIGGDSLKAVFLVSKIYNAFNIELGLTDIVKNPTINGQYQLINEQYAPKLKIPRAPLKECYEMSYDQKHMYMFQKFNSNNILGNVTALFKITGKFDFERLGTSINKLIDLHESLRSGFFMANGKFVQKIFQDIKLQVKVIPFDDSEINDNIYNVFTSFILDKPPLLSISVLKGKENEYIFFELPHIVCDGFSINVLLNDLIILYKGGEIPQTRIQLKDYIEWEKTTFENSPRKQKQEDYWVNRLMQDVPFLNIPTDFKGSIVNNKDIIADTVIIDLPESILANLKGAIQSNELIFSYMLSSYFIFLSKLTNQIDLTVAIPVINRNSLELTEIIGSFTNVLIIKASTDENKIIRDFIHEMQGIIFDALDNQEYNFTMLCGILTRKYNKDLTNFPLAYTFYNFQTIEEDYEFEDIVLKRINFKTNREFLPISIEAFSSIKKISFRVKYKTSLFKESTIFRYMNQYFNIINYIACNYDKKIKDIKITKNYEEKALLNN